MQALPTWITQTFGEAQDSFNNLLNETGCGKASDKEKLLCLRLQSPHALLALQDAVAENGWGPTVDGAEAGLEDEPWTLAGKGQLAPLEVVIAGNTAEDGGSPLCVVGAASTHPPCAPGCATPCCQPPTHPPTPAPWPSPALSLLG